MTEQEFLSSLTPTQASAYNDAIVSIRSGFQAAYANSVAEVVAIKTAEINTLRTANAKLASDHKAELTQKETALTEANATIADQQIDITNLSGRLTKLLDELPLDPRVINSQAFENRLSREQLKLIYTSEDPITKAIANRVKEFVVNEKTWPFHLDSDETLQSIGYLIQSGQITEQDAVELRRDATREEAYKTPD